MMSNIKSWTLEMMHKHMRARTHAHTHTHTHTHIYIYIYIKSTTCIRTYAFLEFGTKNEILNFKKFIFLDFVMNVYIELLFC